MKNFYAACAVLVTLLLTVSPGLAQSTSLNSARVSILSSSASSLSDHWATTVFDRRYNITLQARKPYYFGTTFTVEGVSSSWNSRILSAVRMDDAIFGDQWIYPQLIKQGGQVKVQVLLTDTDAGGGQLTVQTGQEYQLVVRGVWDGFFGVAYSWTLSPTGELADNVWIPIGSHFVWGAPTLGYLYESGEGDNDYQGSLGKTNVSVDYGEVVSAPINEAPVAAFSRRINGLDLSFDAAASNDTDGAIASYSWDFGDGTTGSGISPDHTYATPGTYQVALVVTDDQGAKSVPSTKQFTVEALNTAPVLAELGDISAREGTTSVLTIQATDAETDDQLTFSASGLPAFATLTSNTDRTATLSLAPGAGDAGSYPGVTISVTDGELMSERTVAIVVESAPQLSFDVASISFTTEEGTPATARSVTLSSNDGGSPEITLSDDPDASEWLAIPVDAATGSLSFGLKEGVASGTYSTTIFAIADDYRSAELTVEATVSEAETGGETPRILSATPPNGATGVTTTTSISANELELPNGLNGVFGVDNNTITSQTVRLFKQSSGALVPSTANGTGGGDAINLSPNFTLEANTTYRFEIDGVRDLTGVAFEPFTSTFTTAAATGGGTGNLDAVSFTNSGNVATGGRYTSLAIGPDAKLYGLSIDGHIDRWTIAADGTLGDKATINTLTDVYGERSAVGLVFSPEATAENLIVYVSHCSGGLTNAPAWDGKISELSGADLESELLVVTNLPRSRRDHLTNSLTFREGEAGALYFNQGSNTAGGAPDKSWGNRLERLLSAATLRLDLNKLPRANWPLNAKTTMDQVAIDNADVNSPTLGSGTGTYRENDQNFPDDGTYNPYYRDAPLTLFATGIRNAFDLTWHSNGQLYVPTNGTAGGSNTPASVDGTRRPNGTFYDHSDPLGNYPVVPATTANITQRDWLFRINPNSAIGYYGHPNPLRGEFVLNRGPVDVENYPATVVPDINYRGAAFDFEFNKSPNGVIEYRSNAENGNLRGALLVCRYSGGSDIIALVPGGVNGDIVASKVGIPGFRGLRDPLDIVEDVATGNLYVSDFGTQSIVLIQPSNQASPRPFVTLTPDEVITDEVVGIPSSEMITVFVANGGNAVLEGAAATLGGPDATAFTLDASALPTSLGVNSSASLTLLFNPTTVGPKTATLTVTGTNSEPTSIQLRGLGKSGTGGSNEPSLQQIFDTYGLEVVVGDQNPATSKIDLTTAQSYNDLLGDEVDLQKFQRATDGPVSVEVLSVFGPEGDNPIVDFGWHESGDAGARTSIFTIGNTIAGNGQTLSPQVNGSLSFNPGQSTFGFYSRWPFFEDRVVYGEDALNDFAEAIPHHVRVYELPNEDNAYVLATEEHTSGFDYQDIVVIVRNVAPAGTALLVATPEDLIFETTVNNEGAQTDTQSVTITNIGRSDLLISDLRLGGPFADQFTVNGPSRVSIAPASAQEYTVVYAPDLNETNLGYQEATLTFTSNAGDGGQTTIGLHALKKAGLEGGKEPPLQDVVNTLGLGIDVGWTTLAHTTDATPQGEEVIAPYFEAAGTGKVGITSVARYSPAEILPFGWYTNVEGTISRKEVGIQAEGLANAQTLYPTLSSGTESFSPQDAIFGIYVESKSFGRFNYTEDGLNTGVAHRVRTYPVRDRNGELVEHSYLVCFEDATNGDYQDYVFLLTNVRPAGAGSQVLSFVPNSIEIRAARGEVSGTASARLSATVPVAAGQLELSSSAPWVVLPRTLATDAPLDFAVNAFNLNDGTYRATVTATAPGYAPATLEVVAVVTENVLYTARINFQDKTFDPPAGYTADIGDPYGVRAEGLVFGWIDPESKEPTDNFVSARGKARGVDNNSSDEDKLLNSLNQFDQAGLRPRAPRDWEIAVPNGSYLVEVAAGDPKLFNSRHWIRAEGVVLIEDFVPSETDVRRVGSAIVRVVDGKLTLDDVGAGPNDDSKILYVTLTQVAENRLPPSIVASVDGFQNTGGDYVGSGRVTLQATDNSGSGGIQSIVYRVNGGNFTAYTDAFELGLPAGSDQQTYRIDVRATDNNGNEATEQLDFTVVSATGAVVRIENMRKVPGTDRGFPADDFFSFNRTDATKEFNGEVVRMNETNVMRIHNDGTAPLIITELATTDPAIFVVEDVTVPTGGLMVAPGEFTDVTLRFVATDQEAKIDLLTERLVLNSNADNATDVTVTLRGAYQKFIEGNNEITTQQVFETFGFLTEMGKDEGSRFITSPSSDYPSAEQVDAGAEGDLILSEYFVQADPDQPVRMLQLAALHGFGGAPTQLRNRSDNVVSNMAYNHGGLWFQSILPRASDDADVVAGKSAVTISEEFQIVIAGYRSSGGNSRNQLKDQILGVRVYKAIGRDGQVIPNEYIIFQDYIGNGCAAGSGNCDWQDNAAYIINARPAAVPTASAIADRTVMAAETDVYSVAAAFDKGYAGNVLSYRATLSDGNALPVWIDLDRNSATFTSNAPYTAAGKDFRIRITATDLNGLSATTSFTLSVAESGLDCTVDANADGQPKVLLCEGGSVRLNGSTSTGIYQWTGPNGFTSAAANPVVSEAGVYTLTTELLRFGSCPATSSVTVTEDLGGSPQLSINSSGNTLSCTLGTVELTGVTAAVNPGYAWYRGTQLVGTARKLTVRQPGVYRLTVTGSDGCRSSTEITIGEDLSPPSAGNGGSTAICENDGTVDLFARLQALGGDPVSGGNWTLYGVPVAAQLDAATASEGIYTYTVGGSSNCTAATAELTLLVTTGSLYYRDQDGDGFGNPADSQLLCGGAEGYVSNDKDCNDGDGSVHPGAPELCDGKDNDCNGQIDDGEACVAPATAIRINAGGPQTTFQGNIFEADRYFADGNAYTNARVNLPSPYQTERTAGNPYLLRYNVPVEDGTYTVRLHFAEIYWGAPGGGSGGAGKRLFDIRLEGRLVEDDFDITAEVGAVTALVKEYRVTVSDGRLNLRLDANRGTGGVDQPKLSALEVISAGSTSTDLAPVAIATATPVAGTAPLSVNLDGTASYSDNSGISSYAWNWNGGSASGPSARVLFPEGEYAVTLTVTNTEGLTATDVVALSVGRAIIDGDGDGIEDSADNCPTVANPDQTLPLFYADADGDGYGDPATTIRACVAPAGYVDNQLDNCPTVASSDLTDTDGDGIGNACDDDDDGDGAFDKDDCAPLDGTIGGATLYYADSDGDGFGDPNQVILSCTPPAGYVVNNTDNCPAVANPNQLDADGNGRGDVCEGSDEIKTAFWLEAECAQVGGVWATGTDALASGGQYVNAPGKYDLTNVPDDVPANQVRFAFDRAQSGTYTLFARIAAPDSDGDSYWVRANGGDWIKWSGGIKVDGTFHWNKLKQALPLREGVNSIDFAWREGAARLDKLHLDLDATLPTELGEPASNCGSGGNQLPVAVATASVTEGAAPLVVQFDGSGSYDSDGTISTYAWNWQGGFVTGATPRVSFPTGVYTVTLTVIDEQGGAGTTTLGIKALNDDGDTDGDGILNGVDNCPTIANPDQSLATFYADTDGDGLGDPNDAIQDCILPDGYVTNADDNCPTFSTTDLSDTDGDGKGDACDEDDDNDGVADIDDCAPLDAAIGAGNRYYLDTDGDGFGDPLTSILACTLPNGYVTDNTDNCPRIANPDQLDTNGDGIGDACEGIVFSSSSFWLEAECAVVGSNWTQTTDPEASDNAYVSAPGSRSMSVAPADLPENRVRFILADAAAGNYHVFARIAAPNSDNDSYWVRANEGEWIKWSGGIKIDGTFHWNKLRKFTLPLNEGVNVVDFAFREGGSKLDKVHLNIDDVLPTALGTAADNCGVAVNLPPVARATAPVATGAAPLTVSLDASQSYDSDGSISSYQWSWNGGSATGVNPEINLGIGTYVITLTVTDNGGASATDVVNLMAFDGALDTDNDGVADGIDNCPTIPNTDQILPVFYADFDGDGFGDPDDSVRSCTRPADYVANALDNCPAIYSLDNSDTDGDGIGDACDDIVGANIDYSFEAECATVGSGWNQLQSGSASGEAYVSYSGSGDFAAPTANNPAKEVSFTFNVATPATYYLFLRLDAPDPSHNSLWVQVDGGKWMKLWKEANGRQLLTTGFEWRRVTDDARAVSFDLTVGNHTVVVAHREAGTLLDKVFLSTLNEVPTGLGITATNCGTAQTLRQPGAAVATAKSQPAADEQMRVTLFPNPTSDRLTVDLLSQHTGRVTLNITDLTGRQLRQLILDKQAEQLRTRVEVSDLPSGTYRLQVIEGDRQSNQPFIKMN